MIPPHLQNIKDYIKGQTIKDSRFKADGSFVLDFDNGVQLTVSPFVNDSRAALSFDYSVVGFTRKTKTAEHAPTQYD